MFGLFCAFIFLNGQNLALCKKSKCLYRMNNFKNSCFSYTLKNVDPKRKHIKKKRLITQYKHIYYIYIPVKLIVLHPPRRVHLLSQ